MESRSIAELTDASEVLAVLSQVICLTIIQYLRNQDDERSYQQIAEALKIHPMGIKFCIERMVGVGVLIAHDIATFDNPDAGLASINEDMPDFTKNIIQSIWPDWNTQEQSQEAVNSGQLL